MGDIVSGATEPGVAVVTGGASGFGLGLATECAARGLAVAVLDLDGERAAATAESLAQTHGVEAIGLAVDIGSIDDVNAAVNTVDERWGRVDVLVSNVGVQLFGSIETFSDDEWRWMLDINVIGSVRVVRSFLPLLRRSPRPRIAFTTSSSVLDPAARLGAYQSTKFAVWGLAETLRLELAGDGIAITVVFPSGMASRHLETSEAAQPEGLRRPIGSADDFDAMVNSNPEMAAMLASPEQAAANVIDAVLAGEPYAITHGDLVGAVTARAAALQSAAEAAREDA